MSQYYLLRHFRRLEGVREKYWERAGEFVEHISWMLPLKTLVMDIYFTAGGEIMIVDLNPWGGATDPLLLRSWDRDWSKPAGIVLMDPPTPHLRRRQRIVLRRPAASRRLRPLKVQDNPFG